MIKTQDSEFQGFDSQVSFYSIKQRYSSFESCDLKRIKEEDICSIEKSYMLNTRSSEDQKSETLSHGFLHLIYI